MQYLVLLCIIIIGLAHTSTVVAQEKIPFKAKYKSSVDARLTVLKIAILPTTDNLQGIYARQVEKFLVNKIKNNHHWEHSDDSTVGPILTPLELEDSPLKVKEISDSIEADAFVASRVVKGPNGVSLHVDLFLTSDAKLLAQSIVTKFNRFEIKAIQNKIGEMLDEVLKKIPYDALILSRQGNLVTVNLGTKDGVEKGKLLTVIQIIKEVRHPKFGILIKTDKEILGKIKLLKIDDSLSFGKIVVEKEKGAIQKHAKISGIEFVTYDGGAGLGSNSDISASLNQRADGKVAFGSGALSWIPQRPPTFGQVGVSVGLGILNAAYNDGSNDLSASDSFYPNLTLDAELWLTTLWTIKFKMKQGIASTENPSPGGTGKLSHAISGYDLMVSRIFRLAPSVWGSRVEIVGGLSKYKNQVDTTSGGLTSLDYNSYKFGLEGYVPVTKKMDWGIGANLFFSFLSHLNESPEVSGSADNTINTFGFYASRKLGVNLKAQANLDFELYSTNFSGASAVSASQKHTKLTVGIFYMF